MECEIGLKLPVVIHELEACRVPFGQNMYGMPVRLAASTQVTCNGATRSAEGLSTSFRTRHPGCICEALLDRWPSAGYCGEWLSCSSRQGVSQLGSHWASRERSACQTRAPTPPSGRMRPSPVDPWKIQWERHARTTYLLHECL